MTLPIDQERLTMAVTVLRGAAGQARLYADEAPTTGWQDWNVDNADAFDALADWLESYDEPDRLTSEVGESVASEHGEQVTITFDEYVELMKDAFDAPMEPIEGFEGYVRS